MNSIEQQHPNNLEKITNNSLESVNFSTDDISKIINNLDPNKSDNQNILSIRMIRLCGNSICKPLSVNFNDCLYEGKFPSDWKKAHVVHVHKKGDKKCLKIIDLFPYFKFAAKFLSSSFIMNYSRTLLII